MPEITTTIHGQFSYIKEYNKNFQRKHPKLQRQNATQLNDSEKQLDALQIVDKALPGK